MIRRLIEDKDNDVNPELYQIINNPHSCQKRHQMTIDYMKDFYFRNL